MTAAADILFFNSNRLYKLNLTPSYTPGIPVRSSTVAKQSLSIPSDSFDAFRRANPDVKYIWMQWVDYTATVRVRMFPIEEFVRIARQKRRLGVCQGILWMLQDDTVTPEGSKTGQLYLEPDVTSLYRNGSMAAPAAPSATVMTFWRSETNETVDGCPRTVLQSIVTRLQANHGINVLCGFEIEVVFLQPIKDNHTDRITTYTPATNNHSWSQMTADTRRLVPLLEEVHKTLASMGISLEQFHAESAPGQFEFILPPAPPLAAIDALVAARQTITGIAERHGLRATLHPRPIPNGAGSAAHTHLSISPPTREENFLAGILAHYRAITAFTLSQEASYERVRPGIWAGSEWVAWGFQNRETPVRKIGSGHWEIKSVDGLANPYLAVAALLAGGLLGLKADMPLTMKECTSMSPALGVFCVGIHVLTINLSADASTLSSSDRESHGITTPLPKSISESLEALESDEALQALLGPELVKNYLIVKRAESARLLDMFEEERLFWLLERY